MGEELNKNAGGSLKKDQSPKFRDEEESSRRLGEVYQDLNDFTETKRKIEKLIQIKQSLIDLENGDFKLNSQKFKEYKIKAMEAIDHLFDECEPEDKKKA